MKKKLLTSALLLSALGSCASKKQNPTADADVAAQSNEAISQEIGSALEGDKEARLKFLTSTITKKRAQLLEAKKVDKQVKSEASSLEVEILDNEILLLEAEMFGLKDGLDLNPSEL